MSGNNVCEHQNANYLRMMSERDVLRSEVADLRAGIEALAAEFEKPSPSTLAYKSEVVRALRDLLAGSGEQPGERARCSECGPGYRVGDEGCRHHPTPVAPDVVRELDAVMHHHADRADAAEAEVDRLAALLDVAQEDLAAAEAPVVPDSAGLRERMRHVLDSHGIDSYFDGEGQEVGIDNMVTDLLAVVGQGVTAESVPEHIARYVEATATALSPSSYRAGIASAVRLIRRWRPEYAAVRPSGQEADDDR